MVIALPTWGDLSSTPQTVFGSWYVVGIHSEKPLGGGCERPNSPLFRHKNTFGSSYTPALLLHLAGRRRDIFPGIALQVHTFVLTVSI